MRFMPFGELLKQAATCHAAGAELLPRKDNRAFSYFKQADQMYRDLLNRDPSNVDVLFLRGTMDLQTGDSGRAVALLEKCVTEKPDFFDAWNNLGASYRQNHHNEKARQAYHKALELKADEPDVLANLTALEVNEGKPELGIPFGEKCLSIAPDHPQGLWNLALLYLEAERYEEGFALYNHGFATGDRIIRQYTDSRGLEAPFWSGEDGTDKTIVVWGEQGQGDELLWLQFVHCLKDKFKKVIIDCHPKLIHPVKRAFPWASVYPTRKEEPIWASSEVIDFKQSIASLPEWFHGERQKHVPYIKPDKDKVAQVKKAIKFAQKKMNRTGPVVGIHWLGGRLKTRADLRTIPLPGWEELLDLPITPLSLQYTENAAEEVGAYADKILHWQGLASSKEFDWVFALIANCDLVITVNTTVVHACGAMGKECWTLTPFGRAWRYGKRTGRITQNPFYTSVKQYNQDEGEEWETVMQEVVRDLKERINA